MSDVGITSFLDIDCKLIDPESISEIVRRIVSSMRFYDLLFDDGLMMYHAANTFMENLGNVKRFDERRLIGLAQELFLLGYSYVENEDERGARKSSRLVRSDVEYIALQLPDRKKRTVTARCMHFNRWADFLIADFYEGIHNGHYPKKCAVCGRYFLVEDGRNRLYCDGIDPKDEKVRSCRQVGADREKPRTCIP